MGGVPRSEASLQRVSAEDVFWGPKMRLVNSPIFPLIWVTPHDFRFFIVHIEYLIWSSQGIKYLHFTNKIHYSAPYSLYKEPDSNPGILDAKIPCSFHYSAQNRTENKNFMITACMKK